MIKTIRLEAPSLNLAELITIILDRTAYKTYILGDPDKGLERWENIQEFINSTEDYLNNSSVNILSEFLESIALVNDVDTLQNQKETITLITLHQAKGLEFPIVFIVGMEEGLLPHVRSMDKDSELEEERRLAYVGITRAKERLYLMRAFRRGFRGGSEPNIPSRYLSEIPDKLTDKQMQRSMENFAPIKDPDLFNNNFKTTSRLNKSSNDRSHTNKGSLTHPVERPELSLDTGDKVIHNTFGEGLVINCMPSGGDFELTVAFRDDHGIKRLLLSLAPIQKVE
jgi:DNA helicase-2/ATP-dependent DNA helicase PcrA